MGLQNVFMPLTFLVKLSPVLARNAVLLKMRSGSQEAQYLSELYPLPKTPTLVIIR